MGMGKRSSALVGHVVDVVVLGDDVAVARARVLPVLDGTVDLEDHRAVALEPGVDVGAGDELVDRPIGRAVPEHAEVGGLGPCIVEDDVERFANGPKRPLQDVVVVGRQDDLVAVFQAPRRRIAGNEARNLCTGVGGKSKLNSSWSSS